MNLFGKGGTEFDATKQECLDLLKDAREYEGTNSAGHKTRQTIWKNFGKHSTHSITTLECGCYLETGISGSHRKFESNADRVPRLDRSHASLRIYKKETCGKPPSNCLIPFTPSQSESRKSFNFRFEVLTGILQK